MSDSSPYTDLIARLDNMPQPDAARVAAARARDGQLTKPPGALGRLEEMVFWYAEWRDPVENPRTQVVVFAGNHGVAQRGVSAFPPEVTVQMVANFAAGGAAVNCLARSVGASLDVVPIELDRPTGDISKCAAMSEDELRAALEIGMAAVKPDTELLVVGEMGIGNTTSAAALLLALFGGTAEEWAGPGTGLDADGVARKAEVVAQSVSRIAPCTDPFVLLQELGGREIAAMVGAMIAAREARIPVLLDGFIATSAAAVLYRANPTATAHLFPAHASAENSHRRALERFGKRPLLDLGMRLGEASGATLAVGLLKSALTCHCGMATFGEAGVSES